MFYLIGTRPSTAPTYQGYNGRESNIRDINGESTSNIPASNSRGTQSSSFRSRVNSATSNTPLLEPTTNILQGVASAKSIVPSAGIVGAIAGTAFGGIIASSVGGKKGGYTVPGHDYLGPGNTIGIDAPRSGADAIAKSHDVHYTNLIYQLRAGLVTEEEFIKEIQHTDKKHIEEFAEWYDTTGDWGAFIGKYGLGLKHWIEQQVGHLYPSVTGKCHIINHLQMNDQIGLASTRGRDVMRGNSIIWHSCEEVYPLTIPFQEETKKSVGTQTASIQKNYLTKDKILKLLSKKTITTSYSLILKSIIQAVIAECLRQALAQEEQ